MWMMLQSVTVKSELSVKAKLLLYWSTYIPTFSYGYELWHTSGGNELPLEAGWAQS